MRLKERTDCVPLECVKLFAISHKIHPPEWDNQSTRHRERDWKFKPEDFYAAVSIW